MKSINLAATLMAAFSASIQQAMLKQQQQSAEFFKGRGRSRKYRRRAHFKQGSNTMASRYYSRYSHVLTEYQTQQNQARMASGKKARGALTL